MGTSSTQSSNLAGGTPLAPTLTEAAGAFGRIGLLSFGGPAAQIALMHRVLVDERRWLSERTFLSALSFCMLLPGPEAMQLATYSGWRLHGVRGGWWRGCCSWRRARFWCSRCRSSMAPMAKRRWRKRCSSA